MLIHIRPRLFSPYRNVTLVDLRVEPFGLELRGGKDLATRRPYPNKRLAVACRKQGQKAIDGILIEVDGPVRNFYSLARWAVDAQLVRHEVNYVVMDDELDAASDNPVFWYACSPGLGGWSNRWPALTFAQPMMEVVAPAVETGRVLCVRSDELDSTGQWIMARQEMFPMPTIERGRLTDARLEPRLPPVTAAFRSPSPIKLI